MEARLGQDPDPAFLAACREATGGNPLLLGQLLRSLGDDAIRPDAANAGLIHEVGPSAIARTILLRLSRLPPESVPVAQAVAVLGESADLPGIAALAQMDEPRIAAAIGALARAEILRPERPLDFVHPLVREVVYRDMTVGQREILHAAAAPAPVGRRSRPGAGRRAPHAGLPARRRRRGRHPARGGRVRLLARRARVGDGPAAPRGGRTARAGGPAPGAPGAGAGGEPGQRPGGTARLREACDGALTDPLVRPLRGAHPGLGPDLHGGARRGGSHRAREAAEGTPPELDDLRRWLTAIELVCTLSSGPRCPAPSRAWRPSGALLRAAGRERAGSRAS